jgi:small subunit ribosomal protein S4
MGDPRKAKKSYQTPMHPWQKERIESEKKIVYDYGLKNKKEVWKHTTDVKRLIAKFKDTSIKNPEQAKKEREDLLAKMVRIGIIKRDAGDDEILGLDVRSMLDRRLQTIVYKKKLARTVKQARQFIVHRHILVNGKVVTSPAFIVPLAAQDTITFVNRSPMFDEEHPERKQPEKKVEEKPVDEEAKPKKAVKKAKEEVVEEVNAEEPEVKIEADDEAEAEDKPKAGGKE